MNSVETTEHKTPVKKPRREKEITSRVARFVNAQIEFLKGQKSQVEIATEAGYKKPNIITMFKLGDTRLPLSNINRIAKALEVDPVRLTRMAIQEYEPEIWAAISEALGDPITANERRLLQMFRDLTSDEDFEVCEPDEVAAFEAFVEVVKANKSKKPATRHVM
jgi:hypothetical protein